MAWLLRALGGLAILVAVAFVAIRFDGPFRAAERFWSQPWDEVKAHSEGLCQRITKGDDGSFVVCMSIEKKSHKALQTSFGLPEATAVRLKRDCAEFQYFTPQLRCVEKRLESETREN